MYNDHIVSPNQVSGPPPTNLTKQPIKIRIQPSKNSDRSQPFNFVVKQTPGKPAKSFTIVHRKLGSKSHVLYQDTVSDALQNIGTGDRSNGGINSKSFNVPSLPIQSVGQTKTPIQILRGPQTSLVKVGQAGASLLPKPVQILSKPMIPVSVNLNDPSSEASFTSKVNQTNTGAMSLLQALLRKKAMDSSKVRVWQRSQGRPSFVWKQRKLTPSSGSLLKKFVVEPETSSGLKGASLFASKKGTTRHSKIDCGCNACPPLDHRYAKCLNCPPKEISPECYDDVICLDDLDSISASLDDVDTDNDTNKYSHSPVSESSDGVEKYSTSFTTSDKGEQVMVVNPNLFNFEEEESTLDQNSSTDSCQDSDVDNSFRSGHNIVNEVEKWKESGVGPKSASIISKSKVGFLNRYREQTLSFSDSEPSCSSTNVEVDSSHDWTIDSVYSLAPEIPQFDDDVINDIEIDYAAEGTDSDEETDSAEERPEQGESEKRTTFCLREAEWKEFCQPCFVVLERLPISKGMRLRHDDIISKCSPHCRYRTLRLLCSMNLLKCCNHPVIEDTLYPIHRGMNPVRKYKSQRKHRNKKLVMKKMNPTRKFKHKQLRKHGKLVVKINNQVLKTKNPISEKKDPIFENRDSVVENKEQVNHIQDPVIEDEDPVIENQDPVFESTDPVIVNQDPVFENRSLQFEKEDPAIGSEHLLFDKNHTESENNNDTGFDFEGKDPQAKRVDTTVEKDYINKVQQQSSFQSFKNNDAKGASESPILSSQSGSVTHPSLLSSKAKGQTATSRQRVLSFEKALARLNKQVTRKRTNQRLMKNLRKRQNIRRSIPTINGVPVDPVHFAKTHKFSLAKNQKDATNHSKTGEELKIPHKLFSVSKRATEMRLVPSTVSNPVDVPNKKLLAAMDALTKYMKSNPDLGKKDCCYFMVTIDNQQVLIKTSPFGASPTSSSQMSANILTPSMHQFANVSSSSLQQPANVSTSSLHNPANVSTSSLHKPANVSTSFLHKLAKVSASPLQSPANVSTFPSRTANVSNSSPYQQFGNCSTASSTNIYSSPIASLLRAKSPPSYPLTYLRMRGDSLTFTQPSTSPQTTQISTSSLTQKRQQNISSTLTMTSSPTTTRLLRPSGQKQQSHFVSLSSILNSSQITKPTLPSSDLDSTQASTSSHTPGLSQTQVKLKRPLNTDLTEEERKIKRRKLEAKYPLPPGVIIKSEPISVGYDVDENWSVTSEINTGFIPQDNSVGVEASVVPNEDDTGNNESLSDSSFLEEGCDDSPPVLEDTSNWSSKDKYGISSEDDIVEAPPVLQLQPMAPQNSFEDIIEVTDSNDSTKAETTHRDESFVSPAFESGYDSVSASSSSDVLTTSSSTSLPDESAQKSSQVKSRIQQLKELLRKKEMQVENLRKVVSAFPQIDLDSV